MTKIWRGEDNGDRWEETKLGKSCGGPVITSYLPGTGKLCLGERYRVDAVTGKEWIIALIVQAYGHYRPDASRLARIAASLPQKPPSGHELHVKPRYNGARG